MTVPNMQGTLTVFDAMYYGKLYRGTTKIVNLSMGTWGQLRRGPTHELIVCLGKGRTVLGKLLLEKYAVVRVMGVSLTVCGLVLVL